MRLLLIEDEPTLRESVAKKLRRSGYEMDTRPHFEILGAQYKNNDPDSEEDIYVPIK